MNLTSTTAPMTWHTLPMDPAPVNSSVILPLYVELFGDDDNGGVDVGGDGAGAVAAADVAYSANRLRRTGEDRIGCDGDWKSLGFWGIGDLESLDL